jgi:hypothetical protein
MLGVKQFFYTFKSVLFHLVQVFEAFMSEDFEKLLVSTLKQLSFPLCGEIS